MDVPAADGGEPRGKTTLFPRCSGARRRSSRIRALPPDSHITVQQRLPESLFKLEQRARVRRPVLAVPGLRQRHAAVVRAWRRVVLQDLCCAHFRSEVAEERQFLRHEYEWTLDAC